MMIFKVCFLYKDKNYKIYFEDIGLFIFEILSKNKYIYILAYVFLYIILAVSPLASRGFGVRGN